MGRLVWFGPGLAIGGAPALLIATVVLAGVAAVSYHQGKKRT